MTVADVIVCLFPTRHLPSLHLEIHHTPQWPLPPSPESLGNAFGLTCLAPLVLESVLDMLTGKADVSPFY